MKKNLKKILLIVIVAITIATSYFNLSHNNSNDSQVVDNSQVVYTTTIDEEGNYYDVESVVLYLETYGKLPNNYITKKQAKALGWEGGSVEDAAPDKAIGGDYFSNYDELLPVIKGRDYYECDIDTHNYKNRGSRRLIYSSDGHYYYTTDHYESFNELVLNDNGEVIWK